LILSNRISSKNSRNQSILTHKLYTVKIGFLLVYLIGLGAFLNGWSF
jgi:hypothetical protein